MSILIKNVGRLLLKSESSAAMKASAETPNSSIKTSENMRARRIVEGIITRKAAGIGEAIAREIIQLVQANVVIIITLRGNPPIFSISFTTSRVSAHNRSDFVRTAARLNQYKQGAGNTE